MRVLVDARTAFALHRRGIGRSLVDLYRTLAIRRPAWTIVMAYQRPGGNPFADLSNVRVRRTDLPGDRYDAWENIGLPLMALCERADVLHCPANSAPWQSTVPVVATIHDLIAFDADPDHAVTRWQRRVLRAATTARHIVTPSEYTRQAVVGSLGVPLDRVTANPWAPDRHLSRVSEVAILRDTATRYGVTEGRPYVLYFGAADPRKNGRRVVEAWAAIAPGDRQDAVLLMVGHQPDALTDARALATARCPDGSCLVEGFAREEDLPALISGAVCLCYPSLSEGFGLPVLEAFVCETPVITSRTTSLPEVAGDAAVLVDPTDTLAIRDALARLLTDQAERCRLAQAGAARVSQFTWERCADCLADILERVAAA
jgi:glycosyltransferase involved in cell wall biosynthesis